MLKEAISGRIMHFSEAVIFELKRGKMIQWKFCYLKEPESIRVIVSGFFSLDYTGIRIIGLHNFQSITYKCLCMINTIEILDSYTIVIFFPLQNKRS